MEPGRTGTVPLEVGEIGRRRADRDHRGLLSDIRPAGRADFSDCPFDMDIRPLSNTCSGKLGEVADDEVDAYPGNPDGNLIAGQLIEPIRVLLGDLLLGHLRKPILPGLEAAQDLLDRLAVGRPGFVAVACAASAFLGALRPLSRQWMAGRPLPVPR